MRRVPSLRRAESISFYSLRQDHRGRTSVFDGAKVRVVDLLRIVTAAMEVANLFIAHISDKFQQLRVFAEEMFAGVSTAFCLTCLVLAVDALFHTLEQEARVVA